ncbi:MAG: hypothetical protein MK078_13480 [Crocinitomicaceae bacterium]|nr:hypothetical protein [Crocinitomicaceae bacterium]
MRLLLALSIIFMLGSVQMNDSKEKNYKGKFEKKQTYKKNGQPIEGGADYFFYTKGNSYFVKLSDTQNGVLASSLDAVLGEKVKVRGFISEGLWDTDDPNVQSRIGEYFVVTELLDF